MDGEGKRSKPHWTRARNSRRLAVLVLVAAAILGLWYGTRGAVKPPASTIEPAPTTEPEPRIEPAAAHAAASESRSEPVELVREPEPVSTRTSIEVQQAEGHFVGRLVDATTGEPVPWFDVTLQLGPGEVESTTTDADGLFRSTTPLTPRKLQVRFGDDEGSTSGAGSGRTFLEVQHDGTATPKRVWIEIGPTYFVANELPSGRTPAEFRALLFCDPPLFDDDWIENNAPSTKLRAPRGENPDAWVRFREPRRGGGTPLWLELVSDDGLWRGGARVPDAEGVHHEPVSIAWRASCAVAGRALVEGTGEPAWPALALFRVGDPAPRWGHARHEGEFRFDGLEPGEYRLEVRSLEYRGESRTFTLTSDVLDLGVLACTPIPLAGSVRLRVRSAVEIPIDVELVRRADTPRHALWHSDSWEELPGGGYESAFEWEEVYAGQYQVAVHSHALGTLHVSLGELEPPVDDLLLELPAPPPELRLAVVDAESGAPLADWTLLVRSENGWEELDGAPATLALSAWDEDARFAVCSPGYRAWIAQPGDATWPALGNTSVVARLHPGWSQLILARRRSRGDPVADVEGHLDGLRAGATDARGELWAHADGPPQSITFTHPHLVVADEAELDRKAPLAWISLRP